MLDVLDYEGGTQPPKNDFIYEPRDGYVRLLQIRDFGDKPFPTYIPDSRKLKKASAEDLLLARYGGSSANDSLGRICTGLSGAYNVALAKLVLPGGLLDKGFVKYLFMGPWFRDVVANNSRSCQTGFNREDVAEILFPIAPLNEQRRIVAKLETVLGKVDACQQRLAKMPVILKRFRQAVLAAACSGRLTADWRERNVDIEPAEALFVEIRKEAERRFADECNQAALEGKRKPKAADRNKKSRNIVGDLPDIPPSWGYFRLEELCHLVTDGTHKTPQYKNEGVPFLSVKNVRPFLIRDKDIKFICQEEHQWINSRCNPEKGDILYTKVGATYGYAAINTLDYPFSIFVSLALIKPLAPYFSSAYAEMVMNSEVIFQQARERISGIGTPDLHLIEIRDFRTPLPPLPEQHEIVRRVEALFTLADQLEARYLKAKVHVDRLTQSVLAKAFRGELVPQDPNDEPAALLLERIKAQRTANKPSPRPSIRQPKRADHDSPLRKSPGRPKRAGYEPAPTKAIPIAAEAPAVYTGGIPARILAAMAPGRDYSRADLLAATGISDSEWTWVIRQLKEERKVKQTGEKRGARYRKKT